MRPNVLLPLRTGAAGNESIDGVHNIVIIGANGAGKTRMGAWIETHQPDGIMVHRISAQRALSIPDAADIRTLDVAEKGLFYGYAKPEANIAYKSGHRWSQQAATSLLNDYAHLLATIFAKTSKRNEDYTRLAQTQGGNAGAVPQSTSDIIIEIWPDIMPQNTISFTDGKIMTAKEGVPNYHGKEMSDGERVALYLMGQCLSAPENSIVIIDEPEIHLHKSLMSRLWNKLEELCPNKLLIFITHDLDFAASRIGSKKIWIQNFLGEDRWIWEMVPELEELPANLVIEIVGNRRNVLFCEGDSNSYDFLLYQAAYPTFHIIPRGGCNKVIESTKAINDTPSINHINAVGIIDRDYRTAAEIAALTAQRIFTVEVAEIENLLCIEPLLRIVAENQHQDPDGIVQTVTDFIINEMQSELDTQVTNHAQREIQYQLNKYVKTAHTLAGLENGLTDLLATVDIPTIYANSSALFEEAINERSLAKALLIYNRKNISSRISPLFGLGAGEYVKIIFRMLKSTEKARIVAALQSVLPAI